DLALGDVEQRNDRALLASRRVAADDQLRELVILRGEGESPPALASLGGGGKAGGFGHQIVSSFSRVRSEGLTPVFGSPSLSSTRTWHSPLPIGLCSTPFGTTIISPGASFFRPSRNAIAKSPERQRNSSSVSAWLCHVNSPSSLATRTSLPL